MRVEFKGMGSMTQGRVGEVAYTTDPALGVTVKEGAEAAPVRAQYGLFRLDPWRTHYATARTLGKTDLDGRPHFEIELSHGVAGAKPAKWLVDCETKLLSRADLVLPDPMGGDLPMQWIFSDWKKAGAGLYPHARTQVAGGMRLAYTLTSVEVDAASLAPSAAEPEAAVAAAMKDPSQRTPQAPAVGGECRVETVAEQPIASIRLTIPAAEVSQNLAVMLPEILQYVTKSGAEMAGPPLSRYHGFTATEIDIEACIPVKKPIEGEGRVRGSTLPAGRAATTWHIGPYHELPKSYKVLETYMKKEGLEARSPFWEVYWTDPGIERDPAKWRTQIYWPVK
jgi:AraC family transcriptional regulator